jgi:hypothetical protein
MGGFIPSTQRYYRIYSTVEYILVNIFLPEDGRTIEICSSLSSIK